MPQPDGIPALALPPPWARHAVVYQVFPDRFRRGTAATADSSDSPRFEPWGSPPSARGFQGGDLHGVIDALDHLQGLGVNCLSLNPIFSSAANHRYHTYDYRQVDPLLGGDSAFDALVSALKCRGMRLVLDGVFNHCGRGFWAFHHLLENGESSPYADWFSVDTWPLNPYPRPSARGAARRAGYHCWWNDAALPKFNHANPAVRDYLLAVGEHWLQRGIDGWRLDVADEVPADFWVQFRRRVREVDPEAWIIGEVWGDARPWLQGDQFDGVMNYRFAWSTLGWVADGQLKPGHGRRSMPYGNLDGEAYCQVLRDTLAWYDEAVNLAQLNLLDSHDVPRALHMLQGDVGALKLALVLLFCLPGAPCLYYGTEVGLQGGEEPACREAFPWQEPSGWTADLRAFIAGLAALRHRHQALCSGDLQLTLWPGPGGDQGLLLQRRAEGSVISAVVNRSRHAPLSLDPSRIGPGPWALLWPPELGHGPLPEQLAPQSAVLLLQGAQP